MKHNISKYLMTGLKGLCMGAADVIPGVSGGTIAFMTGIYEELLGSIKSIDATAIRLLFKGKIVQMWKHINGNFLLAVVTGILASVFSLARLMQYLLQAHPAPTWAFFFGLIVASIIHIIRDIYANASCKWGMTALILSGIILGVVICMLSPTQTPDSYWFILLSGAIAICAMILPGISGSFILLVIGKYEFIMNAVSDFNIPVLAVFAVGAALGIIAFSHFLTWLLKHFREGTLAVLAGFIIGSLIKVWPWSVDNTAYNAEGIFKWGSYTPLLPGKYEIVTGNPAHVWEAAVFAVVGFALVIAIEALAKKLKNSRTTLVQNQ